MNLNQDIQGRTKVQTTPIQLHLTQGQIEEVKVSS